MNISKTINNLQKQLGNKGRVMTLAIMAAFSTSCDPDSKIDPTQNDPEVTVCRNGQSIKIKQSQKLATDKDNCDVVVNIPSINPGESDTIRIGVVPLKTDPDGEYKTIFLNPENKKKLEEISTECAKQLGGKYIKFELFDILDQKDEDLIFQSATSMPADPNTGYVMSGETSHFNPSSSQVGTKIRKAIEQQNIKNIKEGKLPLIGYTRFVSSAFLKKLSEAKVKGGSSYTLGGRSNYSYVKILGYFASTGVPYYPNKGKLTAEELIKERAIAHSHEVGIHTLANEYNHPVGRVIVNKSTGEAIPAKYIEGANKYLGLSNGTEYTNDANFHSQYNILMSYVSGGGSSPSVLTNILQNGISIKNPYSPYNQINLPSNIEQSGSNIIKTPVSQRQYTAIKCLSEIYASAYERYKTYIQNNPNGKISSTSINTINQVELQKYETELQKKVINSCVNHNHHK